MRDSLFMAFDDRVELPHPPAHATVEEHSRRPNPRFPSARILSCLAFCLTLFLSHAPALADGRAFPPDDCSNTSPFMAFNGVASGGNTYCRSGQDVLQNAIPACTADQVVAYNGSLFYCKTSEIEAPTCAAEEFLTYDGTSFSCSSTIIPSCPSGEVLTGSGVLACVAQSGSGASCGAASKTLYYYFGCSVSDPTVSGWSCPALAHGQTGRCTKAAYGSAWVTCTNGTHRPALGIIIKGARGAGRGCRCARRASGRLSASHHPVT